MEAAVKIPLDATISRPGNANADASLPRRARTRKGKARLLTLDSLDLRTAAGQAAHALVADLVADLGGADRLSAGEMELVKRAALTGAIAADFETRWVSGEQVELGDYLAAVKVQRGVLATLGPQRRPRPVDGLTLSDLVRLDDADRRAKTAAAKVATAQQTIDADEAAL